MRHNRYYNDRRRRQQKKRFWQLIQALLIIVFVLVIIIISINVAQSIRRKNEESTAAEQLNQIVNEPEPATSSPESIANSPQIFAEAQKLLQQNPDLVGMIGFEDMALYVCQAADNYYYASHRFDGSEDDAGMIFMDYRGSIWPMSDNIVLYGHNMRDGSRFGKLNRYTNIDFLLEHPIFRFASLYEVSDYTPFAVFYTTVDKSSENYFDFSQIDFSSENDFNQYVDSVVERSLYFIPLDVQYGDQLLTLATCDDAYDHGRLVIVCKKIS